MIDAILLCAGKSERFGGEKDKLLTKINGVEVALLSFLSYASNPQIDNVYVVVKKGDDNIPALIKSSNEFSRKAKFVIGGNTRFMSVYHALKNISNFPDVVLIADGARPFTSSEVIADAILSAKKFGSGIAAIMSTDTLRQVENGFLGDTIERDKVARIQTPQAFCFEKILAAYRQAFDKYGENASYTDDSQVYSEFVGKARISLGDEKNLKITYQEDAQSDLLVGIGYDIHILVPCRKLVLCGVEIPYERGLDGHSDADAPVHALMDGILSALGEKDIGHIFPVDDDQFLGANSMELLQKVLKIAKNRAYMVKNVSISIIAEKPKLSPFIDEMKNTLSRALGISSKFVGISATTNEKTALIGEGKAIAAFATCQLIKN